METCVAVIKVVIIAFMCFCVSGFGICQIIFEAKKARQQIAVLSAKLTALEVEQIKNVMWHLVLSLGYAVLLMFGYTVIIFILIGLGNKT